MTLRDKIVNYFSTACNDVAAVYLFGSQAAGKSRKDSDVDIGILFAGDNPDLISKRIDDVITNLPRSIRKDVHPVVMNRAGEELLKQIFGKGECVLVNDKNKLTRFRMTAYSKIANFNYYRNRMQKGLIRNIMEN